MLPVGIWVFPQFARDINVLINVTFMGMEFPSMSKIDLYKEYTSLPEDIQDILLIDRTCNRNILDLSFQPISRPTEIVPRWQRSAEANKIRTTQKAEVFTPYHIIKKMNDTVDEELKNTDIDTYINTTQLEITCGEGGFLTTRYNPENGEYIPLSDRTGLMDRKLLRINKELKKVSKTKYVDYILSILKSTYGYEYQADSLIIARLNILMTIQEFYYDKWKEYLPQHILYDTAYIISWNIWQMDGLTQCIPQANVVKDKDKNHISIDGIRVKIMNWKEHQAEVFGE